MSRESDSKWLQRGFLSLEAISRAVKITKFPVIFPVCREFARRLAQSVLRRQPSSPAFVGRFRRMAEKPAGSRHSGLDPLSPPSHLGLPLPIWLFWAPNYRKSPADVVNIPVFKETAAGDLVRPRLPGDGSSRPTPKIGERIVTQAAHSLHRNEGSPRS